MAELPFRSLLFIPATRPEFVPKAIGSVADAFVVDLEDSVPYDDKVRVRAGLDALAGLALADRPTYVRVNAPGTQWFADDLRAAVGLGAAGVVVPKIEDDRSLDAVLDALAQVDPAQALSATLLIESARGVLSLPRLQLPTEGRECHLAFGAYDYSLNCGLVLDEEWSAATAARSWVSIAAHAYGVAALDSAYAEINNAAGLRANTRAGRALGYTAKMCIHPSQLGVVNELHSPSLAELEWARRVVAAFAEATAAGRAAIQLDGKLVDYPIDEHCRRLLERGARFHVVDSVGPSAVHPPPSVPSDRSSSCPTQ